MDIAELDTKKLNELRALARDRNIPGYSTMKKQDLIYSLLESSAEESGFEFRGGVLEIIEDDKQTMGFLRSKNYLPGQKDIYVSN